MLHDLITVTSKHMKAAELIYNKVKDLKKKKPIITITGEVGTGKSTLSLVVARMLKADGVRVKIIDLDDYYNIPPLERKQWRKTKGLDSIGADELDWNRLYQNISDFKADKTSSLPCIDLITDYLDEVITDFNGVDLLLINGLYSVKCKEADLKVFIELTYQQTTEEQEYGGKEDLDEFRKKVLLREHELVQKSKDEANFYIDFDASMEIFHL
ncbi:MAG: hypothetical protein JEZ03_06100 [Bacteroidales bacterium]|nr:hypothetical protein [Bacteroidales bacterium]